MTTQFTSFRHLTRREFTSEAVMALLAGVSVTVAACSSDSPTAPTVNEGDELGAVSANHGHFAIIRAAQLQAGAAVAITLSTADGHTHSLALTADEVVQIAGGARVSKESSSADAHTHVVTFN
jgi:hypothetical protein